MNIQDWFPLGLTGWISLLSKELSRVFSNTTVQKHQFFGTQLSLWSDSHPYMTTGKTIALTIWTFVSKVMSETKHLLISWLQSLSTVILEPKKIKIMASGPITSWQIDRETVTDLVFWAPKSLQMVTTTLRLKDAFSLKEKLWQT